MSCKLCDQNLTTEELIKLGVQIFNMKKGEVFSLTTDKSGHEINIFNPARGNGYFKVPNKIIINFEET